MVYYVPKQQERRIKMEKLFCKFNIFWGATVAFMCQVFGRHWYLFVAFMILNVTDYITGIIKARYTKTENSSAGFRGIVKKAGSWLVIAISFFVANAFCELGTLMDMDLGFTSFVGWFTLATFIINEIRSNLENLVQIGVNVPVWLIKGFEVASDKINNMTEGKK